MTNPSPQTKLTNPPADQTKMTTEPQAVKMVKIRCLLPVCTDPVTGFVNKVGDVIEVTEEHAKEFCDREFKGTYPFFGERYSDESAGQTVRRRAERVK